MQGTHTFTVALINNEGKPYSYNGQPVETSIQVHEGSKDRGVRDAPQQTTMTAVPPPRPPRTMTPTPAVRAAATTATVSSGETAETVELEVGYLEVWP